jgi:RHS repeat-associated protein
MDGAQAGLGYTGEWWDDGVGLLYLRARWYDARTGRFTQVDPVPGYAQIPRSLHIYIYAWDDPINWIDPSGLQAAPGDCPPGQICNSGTDGPYNLQFPGFYPLDVVHTEQPLNLVNPSGRCTSDCERFVDEVQRFIALAQSHTLLGASLNDDWAVHMLGGYYAGFRMTQPFLDRCLAIPPGIMIRNTTPERWPLPGELLWRVFEEPPVEGAEAQALDYGFRRIFYNNTHHYFANFYEAWFWGSTIAREHNNRREANQYNNEGHPYYESAADILLVEVAIRHANRAKSEGIEILPQLLRQDACGSTLDEIYAGWGIPNSTVEERLGPHPQ